MRKVHDTVVQVLSKISGKKEVMFKFNLPNLFEMNEKSQIQSNVRRVVGGGGTETDSYKCLLKVIVITQCASF